MQQRKNCHVRNPLQSNLQARSGQIPREDENRQALKPPRSVPERPDAAHLDTMRTLSQNNNWLGISELFSRHTKCLILLVLKLLRKCFTKELRGLKVIPTVCNQRRRPPFPRICWMLRL